ncbi:MAG TPA: hypothetical protein VFS21_36450 [Roseiflexaceae bacterium]|nr:hypothetical protein [Roseiflexaceae bacterium]
MNRMLLLGVLVLALGMVAPAQAAPAIVPHRAAPAFPTVPPRVIPPARAAPPIGGRIPIGRAPGFATAPNRPVHTPVLAYDPARGRLAVAWLSWGADLTDSYAAQVWVRVQGAGGRWEDAQTLNQLPVRAFFGGLALTWQPDGALVAAYGDGRGTVWLRERPASGGAWGAPERLGSGQISALLTDEAGALHALLLSGRQVVQGLPRYGVRIPGDVWRWQAVPAGLSYNGQLALATAPDGALRRFVLVNDATGTGHPLTLFRSDDGAAWTALPMPLGCCLPRPERPTATSLLAARGPDGAGVVAVAWSQPAGPGPVAGGVFAAVSRDGGLSFGPEEVIAQHRADGSFGDERGGRVGGFEPSLAYNRETHQLAVSWVEDDLDQPGHATSASNRIVRTRLASRALDPDADGWTYAMTPDSSDPLGPPVLSDWGIRGHLWGDAQGTHAWLLAIDERNMQSAIQLYPLDLPGLLVAVPS